MLVDGQALAGDQRFVHLRGAFDDLAVHRDAFSGAHHDQVADQHLGHRHLLVLAIAAPPCRVGTQRIERPDGFGGLALGARFHPFAEQHQRDHHGRRFEIKMRHAMVAMHQELVDAEPIGGRGAQGHQQIHVAGTGPQRFPAGTVKARTQPELDRRGKQPLQPAVQHPHLAYQRPQHRQRQRRRQCRCQCNGPPVGAGFSGRADSGIGTSAGRLKLPGTVTGFFNGCDELGWRDGAAREFHLGGLGGQIDFGREHARYLLERFFHARHAGGAGHVAYLEPHRLLGHGVAGFFNSALKRFHADIAARLDAGLLGCKINADVNNPRNAD